MTPTEPNETQVDERDEEGATTSDEERDEERVDEGEDRDHDEDTSA